MNPCVRKVHAGIIGGNQSNLLRNALPKEKQAHRFRMLRCPLKRHFFSIKTKYPCEDTPSRPWGIRLREIAVALP
jgi:hypothetical protein